MTWNKFQSKVKIQEPNAYLYYLIDATLQGVNRRFVLSFKNNADRTMHTGYYIPKVEIKDCNTNWRKKLLWSAS